MRIINFLFLYRSAFTKKTKLTADIGIFLIIFAIISSAISIYFESKIDNVEDLINKEKSKEFVFRDWRETLFLDLLYLERKENNFRFFLADHKDKESFENYYQGEISYDLNYCLNILNLSANMPYTFQYAIKDLRLIANKIQLDSYNINDFEKYNNDFIKLYESDEYPTLRSMCEELGIKKIYGYHEENINYVLILIKFFNELKNKSNSDLFLNYKLLNDYFKMSTRYIFVAFLFQFVIFLIIQFFELKSSNEKEDDEKR